MSTRKPTLVYMSHDSDYQAFKADRGQGILLKLPVTAWQDETTIEAPVPDAKLSIFLVRC